MAAPRPPRRSRAGTTMAWLGVAVLLVVAGVLAYELGRHGLSNDQGPAAGPSAGPSASASAAQRLSIASVSDFDPVGDGGNGSENPGMAPLAADGKPGTAWRTLTYFNRPQLGGLKPGVGLLVDLGKTVHVSEVDVRLLGSPTSLSLLAAPPTQAGTPTGLPGLRTVDHVADAGTHVVLRPQGSGATVTTRYVVVWLTSLPQESPGEYVGKIAEISVRGRP